MPDIIRRTVHARVPKTFDIEIHISTLETDQGIYADIREYVVSLEQYGRGITYPGRLHADLLNGMEAVEGVDV